MTSDCGCGFGTLIPEWSQNLVKIRFASKLSGPYIGIILLFDRRGKASSITMSDSESEEVEYDYEIFTISSYTLKITTVAFMPLSKLMLNQSKGVEISGQKLWCGSMGVIEYLLDNPVGVINHAVIELGAGTGVLGMICKKIGASEVYLTDYDIVSINHMKSDIKTNGFCDADNMNVVNLDWYNPNITEIQQSVNVGKLPIKIVAGDVLYKHALLEPFMHTVKLILSLCAGSENRYVNDMLLCHVPRAGVEHDLVIAAATQQNLTMEEMPPESYKKGSLRLYCPKEDIERAKLYRIYCN